MQLFKLKTRLSKFDHFADFAREFKLSEHDLVITNEFLYEPFMKSLNLPCHFIMQEKFGLGEPSDKMMNTILKEFVTDMTDYGTVFLIMANIQSREKRKI